jgi:hypothetical protein
MNKKYKSSLIVKYLSRFTFNINACYSIEPPITTLQIRSSHREAWCMEDTGRHKILGTKPLQVTVGQSP